MNENSESRDHLRSGSELDISSAKTRSRHTFIFRAVVPQHNRMNESINHSFKAMRERLHQFFGRSVGRSVEPVSLKTIYICARGWVDCLLARMYGKCLKAVIS